MNKYWTLVLPASLFAVIYYAYSAEGFVSRKVQNVINPLVQLAHDVVGFIFGI